MKIIDCHGHAPAPDKLFAYKSLLIAHRGANGRGKCNIPDDDIRHIMEEKHFIFGPYSHLDHLNNLGTDVQLISPKPFQMMHSMRPTKIVRWFAEEYHNLIARECEMWPGRFAGIAVLPQYGGEPLDDAIAELERCVNELGFAGCLMNPDPYENTGEHPPPVGDRYWYPLYEKLCELDVPAHIHGTGSLSEREPFNLRFINEETTAVHGFVKSDVFKDFPDLKIVVSHGGGAIPYQVARFQSVSLRKKGSPTFIDGMRNLYYDTVLYSANSIEMLIKTVGADRCIFGSECPGQGASINPETGKTFDDVATYIRGFDWLSDEEKADIFENNARRVFKLDKV